MSRARKGAARRQSKNRTMQNVRGHEGARKRQWRRAREAQSRAGAYAYRDRRARKREFRKLWITRITAACRQRGIRYSQFMAGLKAANIGLNRKMLSEIAIHDPQAFDAIVEQASQARGQKAA